MIDHWNFGGLFFAHAIQYQIFIDTKSNKKAWYEAEWILIYIFFQINQKIFILSTSSSKYVVILEND